MQKFYKKIYQTNDFRLRILGNKVFEENSNWVETDASGQSKFFSLLPNILSRMVGVYYSWEYMVNMSDSIKTGIISAVRKNGDYIKKHLTKKIHIIQFL